MVEEDDRSCKPQTHTFHQSSDANNKLVKKERKGKEKKKKKKKKIYIP